MLKFLSSAFKESIDAPDVLDLTIWTVRRSMEKMKSRNEILITLNEIGLEIEHLLLAYSNEIHSFSENVKKSRLP